MLTKKKFYRNKKLAILVLNIEIMIDQILEFFKSMAPFKDEEILAEVELFELVSIQKHQYFNKAGLISDRVGFVNKGLLRSFYTIKNRETTTFFLLPGAVAASMISFLQRKPAIENIQAMEDSELIVIRRKDLYNLYNKDWKWQQVGRVLIETYYIEMEMRSISLQSQSAKERYSDFLKAYPEVIKKAPQNQIASFLGITPETLSRIRRSS